jgi:hypothetical protein
MLEKRARILAKSILADPQMRGRVAKNPKMKQEVLAKARWLQEHDKHAEAMRIFTEAKYEQLRWMHRKPLFAHRFSEIADEAAKRLALLRAQQEWAIETGNPDPTIVEPPCAARSFAHALNLYCHRRRKPTLEGFDRWLWEACWMYQDERRAHLPLAGLIINARRSFRHVEIDWMCLVLAEAIVLEEGADPEEAREFFFGAWQ